MPSPGSMQCTALSIAGFDGSGGAGLQADLKTFSALGCYGMTVVTAITIQNTCGVHGCYNVPLNCIAEQLDAIFVDIPPKVIKIGMLLNAEIVQLVADYLKNHAQHIPVVLDPVMVSKSGDILLEPSAIDALKKYLLPLVDIVTPNIPEASTLLGVALHSSEQLQLAASTLLKTGVKGVLLKGGHAGGEDSGDYFISANGQSRWFISERVRSKNTHGTGCTLSAAIAANLAQGYSVEQSCERAKQYIFDAILAASRDSVGQGNGPVHHFHALWK